MFNQFGYVFVFEHVKGKLSEKRFLLWTQFFFEKFLGSFKNIVSENFADRMTFFIRSVYGVYICIPQ